MTYEGKADFVVDLGGLELSEDVRNAIGKDIQRAVLGRLAETDFRGDFGVRFPGPFPIGIIIRDNIGGELFR